MNIKEFYACHGDRPYYDTTVEDIAEKLRNQDLQAVVMLIQPMRAGARIFSATVEWELYRPNTAANSLMQMVHVLWAEMMWAILIFQADDRQEVELIAARHGLKLANGIPQLYPVGGRGQTMVSYRDKVHPGAKLFPVRNRNLFTLEFSPAEQSRLYTTEALAEKFIEEDRALRELYRRHGVPEEKIVAIGGGGNSRATHHQK